MKAFKEKYGPWSLITGASSGIGKEYAAHIAAQGLNIAVVARSEEKLRAMEKELIAKYQVNVKVIVADLTSEADINALIK